MYDGKEPLGSTEVDEFIYLLNEYFLINKRPNPSSCLVVLLGR